jgi:hypothetical protein
VGNRSKACQVESQGNSINDFSALSWCKIEYDSPASSPFATGVSGLAKYAKTKVPEIDGMERTHGKARTLHILYIINPEKGVAIIQWPWTIVLPLWAHENTLDNAM